MLKSPMQFLRMFSYAAGYNGAPSLTQRVTMGRGGYGNSNRDSLRMMVYTSG